MIKKKLSNKHFLFIAFLVAVSSGISQSNEITIKFLGNCGLHLTDGTANIYTDFPYVSGAYKYMEYADAELDSIKDDSFFIFTHKHRDHYLRWKMGRVLRKKNGSKYGKWNISKLENLSQTIPDFKIEVFKNDHAFSFTHYSYLITWHDKRIFLSGDTETAETIATIKNIDWAFVPYWIIADANENKIKIDTKMRAIYHLYPSQKFTGDIPEDILILDTQGEIISIPY